MATTNTACLVIWDETGSIPPVIDPAGTKESRHRVYDSGIEELDISISMIIPFTSRIVTQMRIAWRKNSTDTWKVYTFDQQPNRYANSQLITDRNIFCTTSGVFTTREIACKEILNTVVVDGVDTQVSFIPPVYGDDLNDGYTTYYDFMDSTIGAEIKGAIQIGMAARDVLC